MLSLNRCHGGAKVAHHVVHRVGGVAFDDIDVSGLHGRRQRVFDGAHFAVFPLELVRPMVRATTSEVGVCAGCGAPWVRQVEREGGGSYAVGKSKEKVGAGLRTAFSGHADGSRSPTLHTTGFASSCSCGAPTVPATVLDPFCGSGSVGVVCAQEGREFVGADARPAALVVRHHLARALQRSRQIGLRDAGRCSQIPDISPRVSCCRF